MRRVKARKFQIYQEFKAITCHDLYFGHHSYWSSLRDCYDAMVTNGDVSGHYKVTITLEDETLVVEDEGDWAVALLKWIHVKF